MDLNDLMPAAEPVWFTLSDLSGNDMVSDGKPVRLRIHGPDSPVMLAFERARTNKQLVAMKRRNRADLDVDAATLDDLATDQAVAALADWEFSGFTIDGKKAPFSPENARTLVTKVRWIRDWIVEKARDRGNFGRTTATDETSPEN